MKFKIDYILIALGTITSAASMFVSIINGESWAWQFNTLCWTLIAFLKTIQLQRYENDSKHCK